MPCSWQPQNFGARKTRNVFIAEFTARSRTWYGTSLGTAFSTGTGVLIVRPYDVLGTSLGIGARTAAAPNSNDRCQTEILRSEFAADWIDQNSTKFSTIM